MAIVLDDKDPVFGGAAQKQGLPQSPAPAPVQQLGSTSDLYNGMGDYGPPVIPPSSPAYIPPEPTYEEFWDNAYGGYRRVYSDGRPDEIIKGSDSAGWQVYTEDQLLGQASGIGDYGEYVDPGGLATPPGAVERLAPEFLDFATEQFAPPPPPIPAPVVIENQQVGYVNPWDKVPGAEGYYEPGSGLDQVDMTPSSRATPNITSGGNVWDSTLQTWVDPSGSIWWPSLNDWVTRAEYLRLIRGLNRYEDPIASMPAQVAGLLPFGDYSKPDWVTKLGDFGAFDALQGDGSLTDPALSPEFARADADLVSTVAGRPFAYESSAGLPTDYIDDRAQGLLRRDFRYPDPARLTAAERLFKIAYETGYRIYPDLDPIETQFSNLPTVKEGQTPEKVLSASGSTYFYKEERDPVTGELRTVLWRWADGVAERASHSIAPMTDELVPDEWLKAMSTAITEIVVRVDPLPFAEERKEYNERIIYKALQNNNNVASAALMFPGGLAANITSELAYATIQVLVEDGTIPKELELPLGLAAAVAAGGFTEAGMKFAGKGADLAPDTFSKPRWVKGEQVHWEFGEEAGEVYTLTTRQRVVESVISGNPDTPNAKVGNWVDVSRSPGTAQVDLGTVVMLRDGTFGSVESITPDGKWIARSANGLLEFAPEDVAKYIPEPTRDEVLKAATWTEEELIFRAKPGQEVVDAAGNQGFVETVTGHGVVGIRQDDGSLRYASIDNVKQLSDTPVKGDTVFFHQRIEGEDIVKDFDGGIVVKSGKKTVTVNVNGKMVEVFKSDISVLARKAQAAPTKAPTGKKGAGKAAKSQSLAPSAIRAPDSPWDEDDVRVMHKVVDYLRRPNEIVTVAPEDMNLLDFLRSSKSWGEDEVRQANALMRKYSRPLEIDNPGLFDEIITVARPVSDLRDEAVVPATWTIGRNHTGPLAAGEVVFSPGTRTYYRVLKPVDSGSSHMLVDLAYLSGDQAAPLNRSGVVSVLENGRKIVGDPSGPAPALNMVRRSPIEAKAEQAAYRAGLIKTPGLPTQRGVGVENASRVAEKIPFQRGKAAILKRLDVELKLGRVDPEMRLARDFIEGIDEKYLDEVAISFLKGDNLGKTASGLDFVVVGQYLPWDTLIRLSKEGATGKTLIHEIFHHFERFVPAEDRLALIAQWKKQLGNEGGKELADLAPLMNLVWRKNELKRILANVSSPAKRLEKAQELGDEWVEALNWVPSTEVNRRIDDAYRWTGGFKEWFAEVMSDKAFRDQVGAVSPGSRNFIQQIGYHIKHLGEALVDFLRRTGNQDAAERVYRNLMDGKYDDFASFPRYATEYADESLYATKSQVAKSVVKTAAVRGAINIPPVRVTPTFHGQVGGAYLKLPGKATIKNVQTLMTTVRQARRTTGSAANLIHDKANDYIGDLGGLKRVTVNVAGGRRVKAWVLPKIAGNAEDAAAGLKHPMLRDLVQEPSKYNLTPDQLDAVRSLQTLINGVHDTAKAFGVDPRELKISDNLGGFWPDRAVSVKFGEKRGSLHTLTDELRGKPAPAQEVTRMPGGSTRMNRWNTTGRFHYSARDGLKAGVTYDHPLATLNSHVKEAFSNSVNAYASSVARKLGVSGPTPAGYRTLDKADLPLLRNYAFESRSTRIAKIVKPGDAEKLERMFGGGTLLQNVPGMQLAIEVSGFFKSLWSTLDASSTYQQLFLANIAHPIRFGKMFAHSVAMVMPPFRNAVMRGTREDPRFTDWILAGGEALGRAGETPEFLFSRALEHIPVGGKAFANFNDHYTDFITWARFNLWKDAVDAEEALGRHVTFESKVMKARAINMVTGSAQKWGPSNEEKLLLFAPSYYRSHFETIGYAIGDWNSETGAIARRMVANGIGSAIATTMIGAAVTGRDPREVLAPITKDSDGNWRWNSNFMTVRVGGFDIPTTGPYTGYIRFAMLVMAAGQAATTKGEFDGFKEAVLGMYRQKSSPLSGYIQDLIKGETFYGDPIKVLSWEQAAEAILPFSIRTFINEYQQTGDWKEALLSSALNFFGLNNNPMTAWEKYNSNLLNDTDLWDDKYLLRPGMTPEYYNLNPAGQALAKERYGATPKTTNKDSLKRLKDQEEAAAVQRELIAKITKMVEDGEIDPAEAKKLVQQAARDLRIREDQIFKESNAGRVKGEDIYSRYYDFVDSTDQGFGPDYGKVEKWIAALPEADRKLLTSYLDDRAKRSREKKVGFDALYYRTLDTVAGAGMYDARDKAWAEYAAMHPELAGYADIDEWVSAERKRQYDEAMAGRPDDLKDSTALLGIIQTAIDDSDTMSGWITYWKGGVVDGDEVTGKFDAWFATLSPETQEAVGIASAMGLVALADDQADLAFAKILGKSEAEIQQMIKDQTITLEKNEVVAAVNTIQASYGYSKETIQTEAFKAIGVEGWDSIGTMQLSYMKDKAISLGLTTSADVAGVETVQQLEDILGKPAYNTVSGEWFDHQKRKTADTVNGVTYPGLAKLSDAKEELELANVLAVAQYSSTTTLAKAIATGAISINNLTEASLVEVAYALTGTYEGIPNPSNVTSDQMKAYVAKKAMELSK